MKEHLLPPLLSLFWILSWSFSVSSLLPSCNHASDVGDPMLPLVFPARPIHHSKRTLPDMAPTPNGNMDSMLLLFCFAPQAQARETSLVLCQGMKTLGMAIRPISCNLGQGDKTRGHCVCRLRLLSLPFPPRLLHTRFSVSDRFQPQSQQPKALSCASPVMLHREPASPLSSSGLPVMTSRRHHLRT
ncbi:hypothetical protein IWZ00DRAFT_241835 [Phyllosticta capitalensis]